MDNSNECKQNEFETEIKIQMDLTKQIEDHLNQQRESVLLCLNEPHFKLLKLLLDSLTKLKYNDYCFYEFKINQVILKIKILHF
jgi:hypothetical protein